MKLHAVTVFLLTLGATHTQTPRLVVSIEKVAVNEVAVQIKNVAPYPLVVSARTYLVLLQATADGSRMPMHWAELRLQGLPGPSAGFRLGPNATSKIRVAPQSLAWAHDRFGMAPEQPLARQVPPGDYGLQVQILDEREMWWRSNELPAAITASGGLTL
jgi:hypothetical protein